MALVVGDLVVVTGRKFVDALDAATGDPRWRFEPLAGLHEFARRAPNGPEPADSTLYVTVWPWHQMDAPHNSHFHAVDMRSGTARWTVEVLGNNVTRPLIHGGSGHFAVVVGGDGESVEGQPRMRSQGRHVAVRSVALESGTVRWEAAIDSATQVSNPLAGSSHVYVATDRGVVAFDMDTGDEVWQFHPNEHFVRSTFWVAGDEVLVGTQESLHVLDAATGEVRRTVSLREGWIHLIDGQDMYVSHLERLSRYDLDTGRRVWESKLDTRPHQIRVVDGWLYVTTSGEWVMGKKPKTGYLYKLNPETGKQ